jgi:hypothetical protein
MFDRIPLGSAGGKVSDREVEMKAVGELGLQFGLPGRATIAIAAAGIGEDE